MKILLTGGAGFIASHIADRYAELGHSVVIVDSLKSGKKGNLSKQSKFYNADIRDREKLNEIFEKEKPDIVNHHAAQTAAGHSMQNPTEDYEINLLGIINILECCAKHSVKKIIFASSAAVYGEVKQEELPLAEDKCLFQLSPYGVSKRGGELYIIAYHNLYGIDYTIMRYSNVYGPRQEGGEAGVVSRFIASMLKGEKCIIFGDGKSTRDYIFVGDIVNANVLALAKGDSEIINISSGTQTSTNELFETLKKIIGKGESEHQAERKGDIKHSSLDSSKAEKALGWKAEIGLAGGLKKTVEWFKAK